MKKPKTKPILASEVLRHVLKHKTPFPLPPDYESSLINDCVPDACWTEDSFVSVGKSWFARYNGVDGGQVTRWCRAGLPELADGRLLLSVADRWLRAYREEDPHRRAPKPRPSMAGQPLTTEELAGLREAINGWKEVGE